MTATARGMGLGCGADQGVIVTVSTTGGAGYGDDSAVNRGIHMQTIPVAGMTGGAVATSAKILTNGQASQATVDVVTAGTAVMGLGCGADQGVVVTRRTISRIDLNQWAVIRNNRCMGRFPTAGMTIGTVAAGDPRQQVRKGAGMAEITITHVGDGDRRVRGNTWIVTGQTGGGATDMTQGHMINT